MKNLDARNKEILVLWSEGISIKAIAQKLGVSVIIINSQVSRLRGLLGVNEVPYRKNNRGKRKKVRVKVRCLKCGEMFESPDRRLIHRCDKCKEAPDYLPESCAMGFLGEGVIIEDVSTLDWNL